MGERSLDYAVGCPADATPRLREVWHALGAVTDPEIPTLTVLDLGMIAAVRENDEGIVVDFLPTFAGCPALDMIRQQLHDAVVALGETPVAINVVFDPQWTTDRISEEGRRKLKEFGLAPPGKACCGAAEPNLERTQCPYCDSWQTNMESLFGPTLCRSIHYCNDCLQSFEHFKQV